MEIFGGPRQFEELLANAESAPRESVVSRRNLRIAGCNTEAKGLGREEEKAPRERGLDDVVSLRVAETQPHRANAQPRIRFSMMFCLSRFLPGLDTAGAPD
jgi:hypothetical protein